jgi:hypothetical protein
MAITRDVIPSRAESPVRARPELAEGNLLFSADETESSISLSHVGRTLLSVAFDSDPDLAREGHGFSRAAKRHKNESGFSR